MIPAWMKPCWEMIWESQPLASVQDQAMEAAGASPHPAANAFEYPCTP